MTSIRQSCAIAAVFVLSSVVASDAVAQDSRYHERLREREISESVRERVEAALRRSQEAINRADIHRLRGDEFSRIGPEVQERVREALRRAELDRFHFDIDHDRHYDSETRERVREALERASEARIHVDRSREIAEEARERALERSFRDMDRRHDLDGLRFNYDSRDWTSIDSRHLGEEIRARVRESIERSEAIRERSLERALDNVRRVEERARDRRWY